MSETKITLVRGLGAFASTAIVVGTVIGTGIFLVPSSMARAVGSVGLVFAAWVLGGALSLAGALAYAELGAAMPEAGGEYIYLRRAFSPAWGFLYGWMQTIVGKPASIATIAAGFVRFTSFLIPATAMPLFQIRIPGTDEFVFTLAQPLAAGLILLLSFINYFGVRLGGALQSVLTAIKVGAILAIIGFGFALAKPHAQAFSPFLPHTVSLGLLAGFGTAMVAVLWAYDGWNNVNMVASEVVEPEKNLPRSLIGGMLLVGALYVAVNAAYFYILPLARIQVSDHVASEVVEQFLGLRAANWITVAMMISAFATLNGSILTGARVPFAMARDGLFFGRAAHINPEFRTPGFALLLQGMLAAALALTGTFEDLFSFFIFASWLFYSLTTVSVFALRRKEPHLERPYRTWGYPWVPGLFVVIASLLMLNLYVQKPLRSTIGLALILSGLLFYRRWRHSAV